LPLSQNISTALGCNAFDRSCGGVVVLSSHQTALTVLFTLRDQ